MTGPRGRVTVLEERTGRRCVWRFPQSSQGEPCLLEFFPMEALQAPLVAAIQLADDRWQLVSTGAGEALSEPASWLIIQNAAQRYIEQRFDVEVWFHEKHRRRTRVPQAMQAPLLVAGMQPTSNDYSPTTSATTSAQGVEECPTNEPRT